MIHLVAAGSGQRQHSRLYAVVIVLLKMALNCFSFLFFLGWWVVAVLLESKAGNCCDGAPEGGEARLQKLDGAPSLQ